MIAIDLDHCVKNGEISDWAMEIIEHFPKAYIEYSPSGTGPHIFCHYYKKYEIIKRLILSNINSKDTS